MTDAMVDTLVAMGRWRDSILDEVGDQPCASGMHPVIKEFAALAGGDPLVCQLLTKVVREIPGNYPDHAPADVDALLGQLNSALSVAPGYVPIGQRGVETIAPFAAIMSCILGTSAGMRAYRHPAVRAMFKRLLDAHAAFLRSPESRYVINDGPRGWQSPAARAQLAMESYVHDRAEPYWGFRSWHDFFTRELIHGVRPISMPSNDKVVVSACDSVVAQVTRGIGRDSDVWLGSQPASLQSLLDDGRVDEFVGGDLWQSFLSPTGYQHWHSPIAGTVRDVSVTDGIYCAGPLAKIQTRAISLIDADDPAIGLVAVVAVGVDQVSSCSVEPTTLEPGAIVHKGDRLGAFASGGSTHCVLFRRGAIRQFAGVEGDEVRVGQAIAMAATPGV